MGLREVAGGPTVRLLAELDCMFPHSIFSRFIENLENTKRFRSCGKPQEGGPLLSVTSLEANLLVVESFSGKEGKVSPLFYDMRIKIK